MDDAAVATAGVLSTIGFLFEQCYTDIARSLLQFTRHAEALMPPPMIKKSVEIGLVKNSSGDTSCSNHASAVSRPLRQEKVLVRMFCNLEAGEASGSGSTVVSVARVG